MAAMNWLFKEEPSHYAFDALVKDKKTVWSGVKNPLAQKHLRSVKKGDRIFYYHTGDEKSVVGIAKALGDAYADPQDKTAKRRRGHRAGEDAHAPRDARGDQGRHGVQGLRAGPISRLSVMPVSDAEWARIENIGSGGT